MNFEKWLETETGQNCNNYEHLTGQPYLKNRLWWAFRDGSRYGETPTIKEMEKVLSKAHRTIGELRKEIQLTKHKNK